MHFDVLGQELEINDDVIVNNKVYQELEVFKITGFTKTKVRINSNVYYIPKLISPKALLKIEEIQINKPELFL